MVTKSEATEMRSKLEDPDAGPDQLRTILHQLHDKVFLVILASKRSLHHNTFGAGN